MSTISPPRLTRQFQLASDPDLHHPPVLCCRETNLLPSLNAFLLSLYEKYTLLGDLSSGFFLGCHHHSNRANQGLRCMLAGSAPPVPEGMDGCHCGPSHEH